MSLSLTSYLEASQLALAHRRTDRCQVDILYAHRGFHCQLLLNSLHEGAKGVIILGTGAGEVPCSDREVVEKAIRKGLYVVVREKRSAPGQTKQICSQVATRVPSGAAVPARKPTYAHAGYLGKSSARSVNQAKDIITGPNQARITLQLAIASGYSQADTLELFEAPIRSAIGQEP